MHDECEVLAALAHAASGDSTTALDLKVHFALMDTLCRPKERCQEHCSSAQHCCVLRAV